MKLKGRRCRQGTGDEERGSQGQEERTARREGSQTALSLWACEKWDVGQNKTKMKKQSSLGGRLVCREEVESRIL